MASDASRDAPLPSPDAGTDGSSDPDAGPFPSGSEIGRASSALAKSACAKVFECCTDRRGYATEAECMSRVYDALATMYFGQRDAVVSGRLALHLELIDGCIAQRAAATCDAASADFACGTLEPLVDLGGACKFTVECREGYCNNLGGGSCAPQKPDGEECLLEADCQGGSCYFGECRTVPAPSGRICG